MTLIQMQRLAWKPAHLIDTIASGTEQPDGEFPWINVAWGSAMRRWFTGCVVAGVLASVLISGQQARAMPVMRLAPVAETGTPSLDQVRWHFFFHRRHHHHHHRHHGWRHRHRWSRHHGWRHRTDAGWHAGAAPGERVYRY